MEKNITPSDIEVLMHCHFMAEPHPRHDAPAVQSALTRFLRNGIIEADPHERKPAGKEARIFKTTSKGSAWVNAICSVPCPVSEDECRNTCHPDSICRHCYDSEKEV